MFIVDSNFVLWYWNSRDVQRLQQQEKDLKVSKGKLQAASKDIAAVNDQKYRIKQALLNTKNRMVRDMEEFSRDMSAAKQAVSDSQESVMQSIRERLSNTFAAMQGSRRLIERFDKFDASQHISEVSAQQAEIRDILAQCGVSSVPDLVMTVQTGEEQIFSMYNEIQEKNTAMEKLETENKRLAEKLEVQVMRDVTLIIITRYILPTCV